MSFVTVFKSGSIMTFKAFRGIALSLSKYGSFVLDQSILDQNALDSSPNYTFISSVIK